MRTLTWLEKIRKYIPDASPKDANRILWECTGFPMIPNDKVEEQVKDLAQRIQPKKRGWRRRLSKRQQEIWEEMGRVNDRARPQRSN
jgi:hypothetical protein